MDPSRLLLKNGIVLSLDPAVGHFDTADVLIEGRTIAAVGPDIDAARAAVIDASNTIVMPGFVDTHRHMWEGPLRNVLPNGTLSDYFHAILGEARSIYRPEDAYIGDLVSALGALNAGVTTVLDWSHAGNSPAHTDAAIEGLRESGIRGVYAFGTGATGQGAHFPHDIARLRAQYFSTDDQLLTLALAAWPDPRHWAAAREVGASITLHANGTNQLIPLEPWMGPDVTYIHCNKLTGAEWQLIARTGGHVSISGPIEMEMGHGVPPIQQALDHGIRPSLSVDVETGMPGDFFTQMRSLFTLQRMLALNRPSSAGRPAPRLLTVREIVEMATIQGARDTHLDRKIGTLTPGKEADIILLRTDAINVLPVNNAFGAVVLGMDTSNVDTVIVAGRVRKRAGQLVDVDLARVRRLAAASRDYIVAKTGWSRSIVEAP